MLCSFTLWSNWSWSVWFVRSIVTLNARIDLCTHFGYTMDNELFNQMKTVNDEVIKEKTDRIDEMKKNGSEDDILDLLLSLVQTAPVIHG